MRLPQIHPWFVLLLLSFLMIDCPSGGGDDDDSGDDTAPPECAVGYTLIQDFCVPLPPDGSPESMGDVRGLTGTTNENGQLQYNDPENDFSFLMTVVDGENVDPDFDPFADCGLRGATDCSLRGAVPQVATEVIYDASAFLGNVSEIGGDEYFNAMLGEEGDCGMRGFSECGIRGGARGKVGSASQPLMAAGIIPMFKTQSLAAASIVQSINPEVLQRFYFNEVYGQYVQDYCVSAFQFETTLLALKKKGTWLQLDLDPTLMVTKVIPFKPYHLPRLEEIRQIAGNQFHMVLRGRNLPQPGDERPTFDPTRLGAVLELYLTYSDDSPCVLSFEDFDQDTYPDSVDNCPEIPNVDQNDTDGDGIGDACDHATCRNGALEEGEVCDNDQIDCNDGCYDGFSDCRNDCAGFGECNVGFKACGNGEIEGCEICDDDTQQPCNDGCYDGVTSCRDDCSGYQACSIGDQICGNDLVEGCEVCDGEVLECRDGDRTGLVHCLSNCGGWSACIVDAPVCGNNVIEAGEICDGNTQPCGDSCYRGAQNCTSDCSGFEATCDLGNQSCGNGVLEGCEFCDGEKDIPCIDAFTNYKGLVACAANCNGMTACVPTESCGDGIVNGSETCDTALPGLPCQETATGYHGISTCLAACNGYNVCAPTEFCGDGIVNGLEFCDDGASNGTYGYCAADCSGLPPCEFVESVGGYVDISATGTDAGVMFDDDSALVPLGFVFEFYGGTFNEVLVSDNGYLTFGPVGDAWEALPIPDGCDPNYLIAPFWDDLNMECGGGGQAGFCGDYICDVLSGEDVFTCSIDCGGLPVSPQRVGTGSPQQAQGVVAKAGPAIYYQTTGAPGSRRFVVQWTDYDFWGCPGDLLNFQVVLVEGSNLIEFHYGPLSNNGPYLVVGIENDNGSDGVQYTLPVYEGLSLLINSAQCPAGIDSPPPVFGMCGGYYDYGY